MNCTFDGKPIEPRNLLRQFHSLIKEANLPKITFHDLRHLHATTLMALGENPKVVADRLGHKRVDLIIDFSGLEGKHIILKNSSPCHVDVPFNPETDANVMQFRVTIPLSDRDASSIPNKLSNLPTLSPNDATTIRHLQLVFTTDPEYRRPMLLLDNKRCFDRISERPRLGDIEIWSFISTSTFPHPIHIHLVNFLILYRQPYDVDHYKKTGEIVFIGPAVPPEPTEIGLKDTVRAAPLAVTRIIARFGPYTGRYVWHCHILEHEDHEMMRPFEVIARDTEEDYERQIINLSNFYL